MNDKGYLHIYCGDGKGKTTAAVGLCIRAAGNGMKILFAQFLKSSNTGEINILRNIKNIDILRSEIKLPFTFQMNEEERKKAIKTNKDIFTNCVNRCYDYDILILDEVISAYNYNYIDKIEFINFIENKPKHVEFILTGRNPDESLIKYADYISEIKNIKHPFQTGIKARKGIEY